jgi:excisionase family DNA binding protein
VSSVITLARGAPQGFRSAGRGAPDGQDYDKISGVSSNAGVAFLVSESREVMNVRQASQYLGISPDTLYRYITEGEIPAFKLGNRWKLRKTILDRWMERKMSQAHVRRR